MNKTENLNTQVVGNVGLYYVCYRLSGLGWNVMPTARNARGIDVVIYSQDAKKTFSGEVLAPDDLTMLDIPFTDRPSEDE